MDVAHQLQEVRFLLDENRFVSILEEAAGTMVAAVERTGVSGEQRRHCRRQWTRPGSNQEVGMIRQKGPRQDRQACLRHHRGKPVEEILPIRVSKEKQTPLDPSHDDMVEGIGPVEAWSAWHSGSQFSRSRKRLSRNMANK